MKKTTKHSKVTLPWTGTTKHPIKGQTIYTKNGPVRKVEVKHAVPKIAGWEEMVNINKGIKKPIIRKGKPKTVKITGQTKSHISHQPRTLAKFTSIPEFRITKIYANKHGYVELCFNKITKQYHHRLKGNNHEILCQSEPMKNKKDVFTNLDLIKKIL